LLGTILYAEFALDAPRLAIFRNHGFVHIQIGTKGTRAFKVSGYSPDDMLRAFCHAQPAACALCGVHMGESVLTQFQGVKFAHLGTVTETLAAPCAAFDASGSYFRSAAALHAYVFSLEAGFLVGAAAGEDRNHRLDHYVAADQGGKFFRHWLAAYSATANLRGLARNRQSITIAAWISAGAAVCSRQKLADLADHWIYLNGKNLLEKSQGKTKGKSQNKGENAGN